MNYAGRLRLKTQVDWFFANEDCFPQEKAFERKTQEGNLLAWLGGEDPVILIQECLATRNVNLCGSSREMRETDGRGAKGGKRKLACLLQHKGLYGGTAG